MSVPVLLEALAERVEEFGPVAFLISVGDDDLPHTVSVSVSWNNDELEAGAGGRTSANVERRPAVTLLWPAPGGGPYSLIVDGAARVGPGGQTLAIRPTGAVLHRLAGADPSLPSCVRLMPS